ncbi:MAG: hypothetical protein ACFFCQ_11785 [Promethearchaeota archaeon]
MSTIQSGDCRIKSCEYLTTNKMCRILKIIINPLFITSRNQLSPQILHFFMYLLKESDEEIAKLVNGKSPEELESTFLVMEYDGNDYEFYLSDLNGKDPKFQQQLTYSKDPIEFIINEIILTNFSSPTKVKVIIKVNDCSPDCNTYSRKIIEKNVPNSINEDCQFLQLGRKFVYCCSTQDLIQTCEGCTNAETTTIMFPDPTD